MASWWVDLAMDIAKDLNISNQSRKRLPGSEQMSSLPSPLVSIVIPVYNGANYLREAIDSALMQTYGNIEIIVVNDGSTDGGQTEAIARSYGSEIHYLHKENGGVASALNLGIQHMQGQFFSWLSHDDVYYPQKIESQVRSLPEGKEPVILFSDYELINDHSVFLREIHYRADKNKALIYSLLVGTHINIKNKPDSAAGYVKIALRLKDRGLKKAAGNSLARAKAVLQKKMPDFAVSFCLFIQICYWNSQFFWKRYVVNFLKLLHLK
jgi:glycosyltransferase involved in cell wall biosynthesis